MSAGKAGALVKYCGHEAVFVADIYRVGDANTVVANGEISDRTLNRDPEAVAAATHHMVDFPNTGCWNPRRGFFTVPEKQVKELKPIKKEE